MYLYSLSLSARGDLSQQSDLAHRVPAGSAAAASTRPRVVLNISLFHFLTCVCVRLCTYVCFWVGWGRTESSVREFPPPNTEVMTSSVQRGSLHLVFYFSSVRSEVWGINRRSWVGRDFLTRTNPVPLRKPLFLFEMMIDMKTMKKTQPFLGLCMHSYY